VVLTRERSIEREFAFTDKDFDCLRQLVGKKTGIVLSDAKKDMVYSRLARRLRQLRLDSFATYCALIEDEAANADEMVQLTNAITTNLTSFFREGHHFDFFRDKVLPELQQKNAGDKRIRIWSSACSTGEEAYSIAIALRQGMPDLRGWDARILATDLDTNVLEKAERAVYKDERIEGLSLDVRKHCFLKGRNGQGGLVKVRHELRDLITIRQLNLMHAWPFRGPFDVVFCRNVVIYFNQDTQRRLIDRIAEHMSPGGYLFMGHSETLHNISDRFRLIGKTIYQLKS